MGRVLALDYGTVRIGVAISDPLRITAQPAAVVDAEDFEVRLPSFLEGVDDIIVGLPRSLDGGEGPTAAAARTFAARVADLTGISVRLVDERFTTNVAAAALQESRVSGKRRRKIIDKLAATVLLEGYLEGTR
jgi:putative holliday junction resolvase